jgi:DNA-binding beta-propeller fold protein YncE
MTSRSSTNHSSRKGETVRPIAPDRKTPVAQTGVLARRHGSPDTGGSGAPAPTRRRAIPALATLAATLAAMALIATPALAHAHFTFTGSFGAPGEGAGELSFVSTGMKNGEEIFIDDLIPADGVAVNSASHLLYVADTGNNRVDEFETSGKFVRAWGWGVLSGAAEPQTCTVVCRKGVAGAGPGEFESADFVAVDNSSGESSGDVYVADSGTHLVQKFTSSGTLIAAWGDTTPLANGQLSGRNTPAGSFGSFAGIAVDASGDLWAANEHEMFEFDQGGAFLQTWSPPNSLRPAGIAIDSANDLYVVSSNGQLIKLSPEGQELGKLTPGEGSAIGDRLPADSGVAVDSVTGDVYADTGGSIEHPSSAPLETFGSSTLVAGAGLAVDSTSGAVYAASTGTGQIAVFEPEVRRTPTVESESVSAVTSTSAAFAAKIDPEGLESEYRFEYDIKPYAEGEAPHGISVPLPDGVVGSGFDAQEVSVHVQDLSAHTAYHYRVVAHNSLGIVYGEDRTLLTQTTGGAPALPDDRQWEMVSTPDKQGSLIEPLGTEGVVQAAADGGGISYLASTPTEAEPQGYSNSVQVLSSRGAAGWSSRDIAPPHASATGKNIGHLGQEYRLFSPDLSAAVVQPFGPFTPSLSPEASEQTAFLRDLGTGTYTPLVTAANVPPGTRFGSEGSGCPVVSSGAQDLICGPAFVGATPDLSHVVLQSEVPLTAGASSNGYYEWTAGALTSVPFAPAGARHGISNDGSRIVNGGELFDVATGQTLQLDAAEPACVTEGKCASGGGDFQLANSTDSKILFTDENKLTADSGAASEKPDLYECAIVEEAGQLKCDLTDITPTSSSGEPANVQATNVRIATGLQLSGGVLGASEDGSSVYFVADGVLTNAPNSRGQHAEPGTCKQNAPASATCNLYVHRGHVTSFIAALSQADRFDWAGAPYEQPVHVSPDGEWLEFMSQRSLMGYDNRDAVNGKSDAEVYLYHASTGALVCASCNPTNARPVGVEDQQGKLFNGEKETWWGSNEWVAASVSGSLVYEYENAVYQPRYLSNGGRLFFDSHDALVPQDVNGTEDVYEYEPAGDGTCTEGTASGSSLYVSGEQGCVALISSGTSSEESAFLDASESGGDVFFLTTAKLVSQDYDTSYDVYDAHECTTSSPCPASSAEQPPACTTEASCKAPPTPQPSIFGLPSSATFSGPGNATSSPPAVVPKKVVKKTVKCKKAFVKNRRGKCVKRKSKKKAKRASRERRGK